MGQGEVGAEDGRDLSQVASRSFLQDPGDATVQQPAFGAEQSAVDRLLDHGVPEAGGRGSWELADQVAGAQFVDDRRGGCLAYRGQQREGELRADHRGGTDRVASIRAEAVNAGA